MLNVLLLGKTGSGKSSTGNTLLGKDGDFEHGLGLTGITRKCQHQQGSVELGHRKFTLNVLDTPGFSISHKTDDDPMIKDVITSASRHLAPGPNAVLYVVSFGPYTEEDFTIFKHFKLLFGEDITKYITIVFTFGDRMKKEGKVMEECLKTAGKELQQVLRECGNRYVVVDNTESEKRKKDPRTQRSLLQEMNKNVLTLGTNKPLLLARNNPGAKKTQGQPVRGFVKASATDSEIQWLEKELKQSEQNQKNFARDRKRRTLERDKIKQKMAEKLKREQEAASGKDSTTTTPEVQSKEQNGISSLKDKTEKPLLSEETDRISLKDRPSFKEGKPSLIDDKDRLSLKDDKDRLSLRDDASDTASLREMETETIKELEDRIQKIEKEANDYDNFILAELTKMTNLRQQIETLLKQDKRHSFPVMLEEPQPMTKSYSVNDLTGDTNYMQRGINESYSVDDLTAEAALVRKNTDVSEV